MSDIDTAVVDSLTCLTPYGRLEKRTLLPIGNNTSRRYFLKSVCHRYANREVTIGIFDFGVTPCGNVPCTGAL